MERKSKQLEKLFREQSSIMAKDDQDNGNREISFEDVARLIVWAISRLKVRVGRSMPFQVLQSPQRVSQALLLML